MNTPRVSVVIPTYNRSALLVETLESVFAQTCQDMEVIVVNDGSTDDTSAVLEKYPRLRCVHQANAGLNAARNAALAIARGEFFALLDDDDLWEPHKLELSLALADRFPRAAFVFSNFSILRDGQKVTRDGLHTWRATQWHEIFLHRHRFSAADLGCGALPPTEKGGHEFDVYEGDVYATSLEAPWVLPAASLVRRSAVPAGLEFCAQDPTCGDWEYFARLSRHGGALFVDLDIAVNRSHETAGRLTRMPRQVQIARRIAMTERVWLADAEYMEHSGARVQATLHGCLMKLARVELLSGNGPAARAALGRAAQFDGPDPGERRMLQVAAAIPGAGQALRALRRLMPARG